MATFHRPKRVHVPDWRKFVTRRILVVTAFAVAGYVLDFTLHLHTAGKAGEMCIGAVLGHCILEVEA
jgi:hypothetical protein